MMGAKYQEIGEDRSHRKNIIILLTHGSLVLCSELMALNNAAVKCWRECFSIFCGASECDSELWWKTNHARGPVGRRDVVVRTFAATLWCHGVSSFIMGSWNNYCDMER